MQYLIPEIEKSNGVVPFRDWNGQIVVRVRCGGWRLASAAEAVLAAPNSRRLVLIREEG